MDRRAIAKEILWVFATVGLMAAIARFTLGLGMTTALTDSTPWGLWIGFDVLGGVALAAGGFTMAATVYIFHLEKYRPLARPAILTALLGYGAVIAGLICDLGLPWHIWKPLINWQHHSVLFEVAWCVMLYTAVLALEFSPTILEHPRFQWPIFRWLAHWLKRLTLPLVIAGIVLSTLHQSSLGSLFLAMPFRLHPLWYSPLLPVLFFVSAVALGLMMVTLEGFISAYLYRHQLKLDLFSGLGHAAWVLWLYLALRLGDLALRGVLPTALDGSWQSIFFLFEIGISALLPATLLSLPSVRASRAGMGTCAGLTVLGMVLNRLSVSVIAVYRTPGTTYFPTGLELAVSAGIVSAAGLVFLFLTENLKVFSTEMEPEPVRPLPYARPVGDSFRKTVARRLLVLILSAALVAVLLSAQVLTGQSLQCGTPCHVMEPYYGSWVSSDYLAQKHAKSGIPCQTCHDRSIKDSVREVVSNITHSYEVPLKEQEFPAEDCFRCHGDYASLIELTPGYTVNGKKVNPHAYKVEPQALDPEAYKADPEAPDPHDTEKGELECYQCHKVHKESPGLASCYECHHDGIFLNCSVCHKEWNGADLLGQAHAEADVTCLDCHEPTIQQQVQEGVKVATKDYEAAFAEREFPKESCLRCHEHGSYEQLIELTKDYTVHGEKVNPHAYKVDPEALDPQAYKANPEAPDPHDTEKGELECYQCHKVHKESPGLNYCYECHHDAIFLNCNVCHKE